MASVVCLFVVWNVVLASCVFLLVSGKRIEPLQSSAVGMMTPKCSPTSNQYNDGALMFPQYTCDTSSCSRSPTSALTGSLGNTAHLSSTSFTVSLWIRRAYTDATGTQTVMSFGTSTTGSTGMFTMAYVQNVFTVRFGATATPLTSPTARDDSYAWTHWLFSYASVTEAQTRCLPAAGRVLFTHSSPLLYVCFCVCVRVCSWTGSTSGVRSLYVNGVLLSSDNHAASPSTATTVMSFMAQATSLTAVTNNMVSRGAQDCRTGQRGGAYEEGAVSVLF
jgi:hypothetical protein